MKKKYFKLETGSFNYIHSETVTADDITVLLSRRIVYKSEYVSTAMSFDIETTSFYSKKYDKDLACMYIWQLGLDRNTIIGRTWEEFNRIIDLIAGALDPDKEKIICWIQNFSFEWQFIKARLDWNRNKEGYPDIFAKTDRNILYARYKTIEFRDSMALTAMGLGKYKKNYNLDIGKLSGDLDYTLYRHCNTPVTNTELSYCINDVQTLNDWVMKYIIPTYLEPEKTIPLTSTGIVRQEIKEEFAKLEKTEKRRTQSMIRNAQPTEEMYLLFRNYLFRGGLTHANTVQCNHLIEAPFASVDLKSAHPSNMLSELFPYKFHRKNKGLFGCIANECEEGGEYGFFAIMIFHNIRCSGWHSLESKNKLIEYSEDATFDNGRLTYASRIKVCLTEVDWWNYKDLYTWDSYEVTVLYSAEKRPLPDYVRKTVLKYFMLKETLPKDSLEYTLAKRKLNSCFGMAATSLPEREVIYNPESNMMEFGGQPKTYDELTRWLIMLPQWAVWIAAYTRRAIVKSIKACGVDSIYYDTDSNKIADYDKYKEWFEEFNEERMEKNRNMETYDYDPKLFERLGCFELEYYGTRYKVLGAKRYLVEHDGEVQCTVAGMVKGSLEKYCAAKNLDIWEQFTDDLVLPKEWSEKQTTVYCDEGFTDTLTDYTGKTEEVSEKSCVAIINIPFTMNVEEEFLNRIEALRQERERMIYKGVF